MGIGIIRGDMWQEHVAQFKKLTSKMKKCNDTDFGCW